ncbi:MULTISPECIES: hypothetical protein [Actinoalloteichus]|uniref:Uncharacterized protein n=1 Tax=Actinoalloteichus fjordicus TaxID=1612552 RepID=A0AAC9PSF3_9PSEU|nr:MULTISPECIES: hypothetical protein [Actinoalloteichus]APU15083.1 hypothetical protein UA74_15150 [Actinoalloteichus fjordicus]APU21152.1 hypothetical protein UA75_15715 [Actinoalloteichus sp. GBA129-24]
MVMRNILSDLCGIVHPLPDHPGEDAPDGALDVFSDQTADVEHDRERLRGNMEAAWDGADVDPLLGEISDARAEIRAAEHRLRLLIAYGREFVEPRPYTLDTLAQAAGMSVSGVRTAYDDEEIVEVARRIGAKLRRRDQADADGTSS